MLPNSNKSSTSVKWLFKYLNYVYLYICDHIFVVEPSIFFLFVFFFYLYLSSFCSCVTMLFGQHKNGLKERKNVLQLEKKEQTHWILFLEKWFNDFEDFVLLNRWTKEWWVQMVGCIIYVDKMFFFYELNFVFVAKLTLLSFCVALIC